MFRGFAMAAPLLLCSAVVYSTWSAHPSREGSRGDETVHDPREAIASEGAARLDTLVVDFKDDVGDRELAANDYIEEAISAYSRVDRLYRIRFPSAAAASRAEERLRRDPTVESVDLDLSAAIPQPPPDLSPTAGPPSAGAECEARRGQAGAKNDSESSTIATRGFPDDPCYRYQWHLRQIGLPDAWKLGQGKGAVVAVVDTGVSRVPDLAGVPFVAGYNFVADSANANDDHGHGTHVAGTIAQATHNGLGVGGVAFGAKIMPLKVLSSSGSGSMAAIAQAIRWAADHGAHVINMSLGGPFPVTTIKRAVEYARAKGVVVVAAAGNDGRGRVGYPARYPGVLAVAATQFDETTTFYSNWGKEIDLAAPGGNVRVDQDRDGKPDGVLQNTVVPGQTSRADYLWFMGTSMASPHVAGVAALLVGAGVTKPVAVESILLGTARKPKGKPATGDPARGEVRLDDRYGAGIVDAGAALRKARLGRGAGGLGLGASLALLGAGMLRRRRLSTIRLGLGFVGPLVFGAAGFFELAAWVLGPGAFGNPLLASAGLPFLAIALGFGMVRLRPGLAGFTFGLAGALLFAALTLATGVRLVPDLMDRAWLIVHAVTATLLATLVLRRGSRAGPSASP